MRKFILLFSALVLSFSTMLAQDKTISGTVVDENGEAVIGATIRVKGAEGVGTVTDIDGNFTIKLPAGKDHLLVTYVGYTDVDVKATPGMKVQLKPNTEMLDEVMVIAYSATTKKGYAGSAEVMKGETIEKKSPTEVSKALAGEIAGVQVVNSSGQPGSNATVRIRGIGSVNSSTAPLYVVDGIPYDGDISAIDPSDIASTTVLKDATSTSLYGARGANGVILITTKQGTSGETGKIDVDVKYGGNMRLIPMYETISDPQQYVELVWLGIKTQTGKTNIANNSLFNLSAGGLPAYYNRWDAPGNTLIDPETGKFYPDVKLKQGFIDDPEPSWRSQIFRNGQKLDATVKIHGGSDKTTYYTSFGYLKDEGYYIGSDYQRVSVRSNISHQAKKWLKGNLNMAYSYSTFNNPGQSSNMNNGFAYVNECPAIYPVFQRDENGNRVKDPKFADKYAYDYGDYDVNGNSIGRLYGQGINPAGALQYDKQNTIQHQFVGNGMLEVSLYKGLKFTTNFGAQYIGSIGSQLTNNYYGDAANIGRIYKSNTNSLVLTWNQLLQYALPSGSDHSFDAFLAHEMYYVNSQATSAGKNMLVRPDGLELGNAVEMSYITSNQATQTIDSYFGQARYNYKEKYFIHGTLRGDGSSRFAKGHRWGLFGSIGVAWLMSNEDFMENVDLLKNFKIRASWGVLGNQEIGTFLFTNQYGIENVGGYPGYVLSYIGNPELTWERSHIANVGVDFELGKYLTASVEYFYKYTDNMLFPRYVAPSLGYSYYYVNEGALANQGVEFQFNIHAVDTRNLKLDIRLNGAWYDNKVKKMPTDNSGKEYIMNAGLSLNHSPYDYYTVEYAGVNPENGKAQYYWYYDPKKLEGAEPDLYKNSISSVYNYIATEYKDDPRVNEYLKNPELLLQKAVTDNYNYASSTYVGKSSIPALQGGFGLDFTFYGFDLSASFQYSVGGWGYDSAYASLMHSDRGGSQNWHVDILNCWKEEGDITDVPRLSNGNDLYANSGSTRFLISSSYLNLSNVRLGYSFPKKWMEKIKLNNLSVWVAGDNLFCLSARKGYIPMASFTGGSSTYSYSPLSTIMGGIKFSF